MGNRTCSISPCNCSFISFYFMNKRLTHEHKANKREGGEGGRAYSIFWRLLPLGDLFLLFGLLLFFLLVLLVVRVLVGLLFIFILFFAILILVFFILYLLLAFIILALFLFFLFLLLFFSFTLIFGNYKLNQ